MAKLSDEKTTWLSSWVTAVGCCQYSRHIVTALKLETALLAVSQSFLLYRVFFVNQRRLEYPTGLGRGVQAVWFFKKCFNSFLFAGTHLKH
jgi:hypothetical protein